jgi:hypothetical protein
MWLLLYACAAPAPKGPGAEGGERETGETGVLSGDTGGGDSAAPPLDCAEGRPTWVERGEELGLEGVDFEGGETVDGGGLALEDIDGDGLPELILSWGRRQVDLYRWDGATFTRSRLPDDDIWQPSFADLDGDGDPDLLASGESPGWYENEGGALLSLHELEAPPLGAARELRAFDREGDGDLDIFALRTEVDNDALGAADHVYTQVEPGVFISDALPATVGARQGFDLRLQDLDGDMDPDVYVANDMGITYGPNYRLRNEDGEMVDVSEESYCDLVMSAMGAAAGDVNGDGLPDLLISDTFDNRLLLLQEDGSCLDATATWGSAAASPAEVMSWGANLADLDNDGWLDVAGADGPFGRGHDVGLTAEGPPWLLWNAQERFEVGELPELPEGAWRAVLTWDWNGDGVLDLLISSQEDRPLLLLSEGCTQSGWLELLLPEGARVEAEVEGRTLVAWASRDQGYATDAPALVHLGLGAAQGVDVLRVQRRGAAEPEVMERVAGRQRLDLR